jgi:nitrite reductase (NADH) large subunit
VSEPLVIVGNGMAAARLVDELAKVALGRYAIAVIGAEPRLAYNRVLLSSVLAGETASHEIELKPADWWRDRGVTVKYNCLATEIDVGRRELKIANDESIEFSKLILATGSTPLRLNVPGNDLAGVHTFRDTRDVDLLLTLAAQKKRVVVVGGGLLGLEAAYGLAKAGALVTLIHLMDRLMERQLDAPAAALLKSLVERKGIEILLNANTARIHGETRVEGVELVDGRRIEAEAVIFAAGIRPNVALAKEAGISVNRGVVVDDHLETGVPDVFALGECAEHRGICYGLVEPAYEQARVLARHLAGRAAGYQGSVVATNLKVSGVSVFSAGDFMGQDFLGEGGSEAIVLSDLKRGTYKKLVISDGRLTGAVLIGDVGDALWYLELIRNREPIAKIRTDMMFGRALALPLKAA